VIVGYLFAAAFFELVLALRHTMSPDGEGFVVLVAVLGMAVGAFLLVRGVRPAAFVAPVAALFVAARFYTGDPYDAPYFQSYAEGGFPTWMFLLLGAAIVTGVTGWVWRRTRPFETVAVVILLALTVVFMNTH
jgi:uncharacterized membrane protein HdeD (DUF308 family)